MKPPSKKTKQEEGRKGKGEKRKEERGEGKRGQGERKEKAGERKEKAGGRKEGKGRRKKGKAYSKVVPKNSGDTLSPSQALLYRLSIMKLSPTHQAGFAILHLPTAALLNTDHTYELLRHLGML